MTTFQNVQLKLAGTSSGRVALHLVCLCRDGKLRWHARGVVRELQTSFARWWNLPGTALAGTGRGAGESAAAQGVSALHDTLRLGKPVKALA